MTGPFDLRGKVVLVTGANAGLGFAFADALAAAGADLAIWGRRAERNAEAVQQLLRHGRRVLGTSVDVADEAQVTDGIGRIVEDLGRIDGVIANAGVNPPQRSFLDIDATAYHELLAINLHGGFVTLRESVRHMADRARAGDPGGSLIVCGSLSVTHGIPRRQHYAAAKAGLTAVARGVAAEYGHLGIRANTILPGRIVTDLGDRTATDQAEREAVARDRCPIPRLGRPADVAGIAVYLMSDAASYHTADVITVDGGLSACL